MIPAGPTTLLRLHHIGFVVANIAESAPGFLRSIGGWNEKVFADPGQKVKVTFLRITAGDVWVELVEPDAEDAPVHKFLRERAGAA